MDKVYPLDKVIRKGGEARKRIGLRQNIFARFWFARMVSPY